MGEAYNAIPGGLGRALHELITQDKNQVGFSPLPGPTGLGKTFEVLSCIADMLIEYKSECRRIVFTTNIKRNLPFRELEEVLRSRGRKDLVDLIGFLDSNTSSVQTNLDAARNKMPPKPIEYLIKDNTNTSTNGVKKEQFDIRNLSEFLNIERTCKHYEDIGKNGILSDAVRASVHEKLESDLAENDRKLRNAISSVFRSMCVADGDSCRLMSLEEKHDLIENDPDWAWLGILYPAVFTYKKRVLFMSLDKMLVQNSTILEAPETIWESNLLQGSIVFIDEFELSKTVINNKLIKDSIEGMTDAISLFRTLFASAFEMLDATSVNAEPADIEVGRLFSSELFRSPSDNPGYGKQLLAQYKKLVYEAINVYQELHINKQLQLDDEYRHKQQAFLFNDFQSHVISDKARWATIKFLETHNQVSFGKDNPPHSSYQRESSPSTSDEAECYPAELMISRLEGLRSWCVGWITRVAENYMRVVAEDATSGQRSEIGFDYAVGTVLSELNIMDEVHGDRNPTRERIISLAHENRARRLAAKGNDKRNKANLCIHETGFSINAFLESNQHDTITRVEHYGIPCTAETKLLNLAQRNLVIGISASLDIPSVLGNYDMDYVSGMLGSCYYPLTTEQRTQIKSDYQTSIVHYDQVRIEASILNEEDSNGQYSKQAWETAFHSRELAEQAFNKVELALEDKDEFHARRILKICSAYAAFWQADDSRAMLCVLNKLPKHRDSKLDQDLLGELFTLILQDLGMNNINIDSTYRVLGGSGEIFDKAKEGIVDALSAGEKLFVITTYQSSGAGQNLQFKIPKGVQPICINNRAESSEMDFDCIYLEHPTHIAPTLNPDTKLNEDDILEHILENEYLYEVSEITRKQLLREVKQALKAATGSNELGIICRTTPSVALYGARQVYQAVGRLCRTNMKNPTIRLFADRNLLDGVPFNILEQCGVTYTPEFSKLFSLFDTRTSIQEQPVPKIIDDRANNRARSRIQAFLRSGWNEETQQAWKELGEQVLAYPTLPNGWSEAPYIKRNYYVEFDYPTESYKFNEEGDFRNVVIARGESNVTWQREVSQASCRLDTMMKIPGLEEHFNKFGYATRWTPSTTIMAPIVAESIYKGRLGEVAGCFILGTYGVDIQEIESPEQFERFDYVVSDGLGADTYIDFKHWRKSFDTKDMNSQAKRDRVFRKMEVIGATKAIVVNVLPPDNNSYEIGIWHQGPRNLMTVPALVRADFSFDEEAIIRVKEFIYGSIN